MPEKPTTAGGYAPDQVARVKATCLYLATKLGDLMLRSYGRGVADVAAELRPLLSEASAQRATEYLRSDFQDSDSTGPRRVAEFLFGRPDEVTQADAVGFVRQLLNECMP
jgi:hypothetical protein